MIIRTKVLSRYIGKSLHLPLIIINTLCHEVLNKSVTFRYVTNLLCNI